ncbi:hypothetical protein C5167_021441 [Papaver somniferum]|uniref:uncharacterized protein LOC113345916 n=1 Tax=Papaver somniferum TaxID=3469 RepID=UPI000E6F55A7|nr:uncharacterized protein LOC113345916 [Papaver somniferum]RZC94199.1 hypothetical protein C5167_021441 [Papaver somniferum]
MEKTSSLVFGVLFFMLVVLQIVYVSGIDLPEGVGQCDAKQQVDIGSMSSCAACEAACRSASFTSICITDSTNTGALACKCCLPDHLKPIRKSAAATTTTSLPFLSFSLFLGFMVNRLIN